MTNGIDDAKAKIMAAVNEKLLEMLLATVDDAQVVDQLAPIIPPLVSLAIAEGEAVASQVLAGLMSESTATYDYWRSVIQYATPEQRIVIMEGQRQAAIQDTLKKLARDEQRMDVLKLVLKTAFALLPLLL